MRNELDCPNYLEAVHSAEEKIRIVLEALRGERSTATLCRPEGIVDKVENAKRIGNSEVLLVTGGFHLMPSPKRQVERVIDGDGCRPMRKSG